MGIIQSFIRIKLNHYHMILRAIVSPKKKLRLLKKHFTTSQGQ